LRKLQIEAFTKWGIRLILHQDVIHPDDFKDAETPVDYLHLAFYAQPENGDDTKGLFGLRSDDLEKHLRKNVATTISLIAFWTNSERVPMSFASPKKLYDTTVLELMPVYNLLNGSLTGRAMQVQLQFCERLLYFLQIGLAYTSRTLKEVETYTSRTLKEVENSIQGEEKNDQEEGDLLQKHEHQLQGIEKTLEKFRIGFQEGDLLQEHENQLKGIEKTLEKFRIGFQQITASPLSLKDTERSDGFGVGLQSQIGDEESDSDEPASEDEAYTEEKSSEEDEDEEQSSEEESSEEDDSDYELSASKKTPRGLSQKQIDRKVKIATEVAMRKWLLTLKRHVEQREQPDGTVPASAIITLIQTELTSMSDAHTSQNSSQDSNSLCKVCAKVRLTGQFQQIGTCSGCTRKRKREDE
jgi:hypothetical protein